MGLGSFFKDKFEKKECALCGKECGIMRRSKLKGGDYICDECGNLCSAHVRLSEMTLDEVKGHIEYMKQQDRLFEEVYSKAAKKVTLPYTLEEEGIEFCDELGMFRIVYKSFHERGKRNELFRYDQVASYEPYIEETPGEEPGQESEFEECGMKIKLLYGNMHGVNMENKKGLRPHPYIKHDIMVCFGKKDRSSIKYTDYAMSKFDGIFGVNDHQKGLFGFQKSKEEKRQEAATMGMTAAFSMAIKAAKNGEAFTEEDKAKFEEHMEAVNDAATGGMAVYTRRADEAEAKVR